MNGRLLFCIALGVFTAHIGVVMFLSHLRPQPKFVLRPRANFSSKETPVIDRETGERAVYREFTVTTRFATPPPATEPLAAPQPAVAKRP